eukprot:1365066-Karenia_brevis.AAC.1
MNLGEEHIGMSRKVYDLNGVLPAAALTENSGQSSLVLSYISCRKRLMMTCGNMPPNQPTRKLTTQQGRFRITKD